jgi:uncharacterized surface protein with fasciclin (FAS1) repeats
MVVYLRQTKPLSKKIKQMKTLKRNFKPAVFFAFAVIVVITSCSKSSSTTTPPQSTIAQLVSSGSNFTLLSSAVTKAGLGATLSGAGPFTVFAPTDSAFNASGITASTISNTLSASDLQTILLYHTLPEAITAANVPAGPDAKVITAGGDSVFVTNNANGVFVNGIKVTIPNITASNGIIHEIGRVLIPSFGQNIVQLAQADTSLSYLVAAVLQASTGSTNVAGILSGAGPFTVFAPTNQAFRNAGFPTIASIQAADPATLTTILTYHVIGARVFSSDLTNGETPTTVNGEKVTISLSAGATVKGNSNASASNIIATNIVATNGVVHVIDQVLLP